MRPVLANLATRNPTLFFTNYTVIHFENSWVVEKTTIIVEIINQKFNARPGGGHLNSLPMVLKKTLFSIHVI